MKMIRNRFAGVALPAVLALSVSMLDARHSAQAQSTEILRQQNVAVKYQREQVRLEQLRARKDAAAALELGRLLKTGVLVSATVV